LREGLYDSLLAASCSSGSSAYFGIGSSGVSNVKPVAGSSATALPATAP
jgi:hypothetical protein